MKTPIRRRKKKTKQAINESIGKRIHNAYTKAEAQRITLNKANREKVDRINAELDRKHEAAYGDIRLSPPSWKHRNVREYSDIMYGSPPLSGTASKKLIKQSVRNVRKNSASPQAKKSAIKLYRKSL